MKRRDFINGIAASAWPVAVRAEQPTMSVVGILSSGSPEVDTNRINAVRQGLNEAGYIEAQSVTIEYRGARGQYDQLQPLAADLVRRRVAAIVTVATPATLAAKAATNTIPIVFAMGADPVQLGVITSLNRPNGNVTGVYILNEAVAGKRLELLHELIPNAMA